MCTVCGCSGQQTKIEGAAEGAGERGYVQVDGTAHSHGGSRQYGITHSHSHSKSASHHHGHHLHYGLGPGRAHVAGMSQSRMIQVEQDILGKNNGYAEKNRCYFREHGMLALNLVSSPGSGKTTLLVYTANVLRSRHSVCVIEGDQQTSLDADRIRATGVPAIQINTGRGCHLDAHMVGQALERLHPADNSLMLIENVGNLVCPAAFDLGEAHKVAILSVTEGEDKPLKYPDMFAAANLMLLNKADLLPHLDFDVALAIEYARRINPDIRVIVTSARSGEGMEEWLQWLDEQMALHARAAIALAELQE